VEKLGNLHVTVVSGLPRSGTSMMMQMLAVGGMEVLTDGVRGPDADNLRGYFEFEAVKRTVEDARWVQSAVGKAVKVVYLLLPNLPGEYEYRVLFMRRDIEEVLASQRAMLGRLGKAGADLTPAKLAEVIEAQIRRVRGWVSGQSNFSVIDVDYREVLENPLAQAARVNRFVGGGLDEGKMAGAVDASMCRH
jgi:hypothetical protein